MDKPLVSVIIPVGSRHVRHCRVAAASVASQSVAPLVETILIADGETEIGTVPGCTVLPSDGARRGPARTRNRGIEKARGQFLTFLDADDYLLPRGIEHLLRAYADGDHGYTYGDCYTIEPWEKLQASSAVSDVTLDRARQIAYVRRSAPDYIQDHMRRYNIHVVNILVPSKHARAVGGYDEGVDAWEDWSFHLRLAMAGICGYRVPMPIFVYRVYEGDRMTRFYGGAVEHMDKVKARYQDERGHIPMASCCGGDAPLAHLAAQAVAGMAEPNPVALEGDMVRVQYMGDERGSIPFDFGQRLIRLGNNARHRYADVTQAEAAWLAERVPLRIVPQTDPAVPPPEPLVLQQDTPALRPKGRTVAVKP